MAAGGLGSATLSRLLNAVQVGRHARADGKSVLRCEGF